MRAQLGAQRAVIGARIEFGQGLGPGERGAFTGTVVAYVAPDDQPVQAFAGFTIGARLARVHFHAVTALDDQRRAPYDEVLTQFDYGTGDATHGNNLLLRGQTVTSTDGGTTTTLRTCYGYDAYGNRISETQPNANLSSCP